MGPRDSSEESAPRRSSAGGYVPFAEVDARVRQGPWEVVCFVYPSCDGTCAHCWSFENYLGRPLGPAWHARYWSYVDPQRLALLKLTGGETFLNKRLGAITKTIRCALGPEPPIQIFTSGRPFLTERGADEEQSRMAEAMRRSGVLAENVEIHLSADEQHAGTLYRSVHGRRPPFSAEEIERTNRLGAPLMVRVARSFLQACDLLVEETHGAFRGGRLKVHAGKGRLAYHREELYGWMDDETWAERVVSSEGLIRAGRARQLVDSIPIGTEGPLSLFLLPGAAFQASPKSVRSETYRRGPGEPPLYLEPGKADGPGAALVGWWSLIDRTFCGGTAYEALDLIGREEVLAPPVA